MDALITESRITNALFGEFGHWTSVKGSCVSVGLNCGLPWNPSVPFCRCNVQGVWRGTSLGTRMMPRGISMCHYSPLFLATGVFFIGVFFSTGCYFFTCGGFSTGVFFSWGVFVNRSVFYLGFFSAGVFFLLGSFFPPDFFYLGFFPPDFFSTRGVFSTGFFFYLGGFFHRSLFLLGRFFPLEFFLLGGFYPPEFFFTWGFFSTGVFFFLLGVFFWHERFLSAAGFLFTRTIIVRGFFFLPEVFCRRKVFSGFFEGFFLWSLLIHLRRDNSGAKTFPSNQSLQFYI